MKNNTYDPVIHERVQGIAPEICWKYRRHPEILLAYELLLEQFDAENRHKLEE